MHRGVALALAVVCLAGASIAEAQDAAVLELQRELAETRARLDELQSRMDQFPVHAEPAPAQTPAQTPAWASWLEDVRLFGDLRLRYQGDFYEGDRKDRHRGRFRARVGVKKSFLDDQVEIGTRWVSGADDDPSSTNQTFGEYFSEKSLGWDLAYARFSPDAIPGLTAVAGKMSNPFFHTDLLWDSDINPEGVWAQYTAPSFGDIEPFVNGGLFVIRESSGSDIRLGAVQAGLVWDITPDVTWTSAGTIYDYDNFALPDSGFARGNHLVDGMLAAEEFQVLNWTNKVAFDAFGLPMAAFADYAYNCGDVDSTPGWEDRNSAYAVGLTVGRNKKRGDWSVGYKYAYIEPNAVVGMFADGDFGGANRKGHSVGGAYSITDAISIGGRVFATEPVVGDSGNHYIVQADLVWKF